jgi:hypothetical protein
MNFENYLCLKKALRIAMPCLALSFFVSCSNEETTGASNESTPPASNLTLTATVPVAKEHSSTRVGIKDDASASPNYVWLEGERLTLYWKNLHDDDADQVLVYKVEGVSADGKSCLMNPVDPSAKLDNGFYKIHSLSPDSEFNFVNGELSATIDLGNQNQPSGAVDHNYLSDKLYQYATTVVQVYEGDIISGTTNLPFEFITALMRVRVVNNTGLPIDVKKVKLSYSTENNPQFYSKGIFTANEFVGDHSYTVSPDATLNDQSVTTNYTLANDDYVDFYMSLFPTAGYSTESQEIIHMAIDYLVSGSSADFYRSAAVSSLPANSASGRYLQFDAGDVLNLELTINKSDAAPFLPLKLPELTYQTIGSDTYSVTALSYMEGMQIVNGRVYMPATLTQTACAPGWSPVTPQYTVEFADLMRKLVSDNHILLGGLLGRDGIPSALTSAVLVTDIDNRTDGLMHIYASPSMNSGLPRMTSWTAVENYQALCKKM